MKNTLSENELLENTLSENTFLETTLSENTLFRFHSPALQVFFVKKCHIIHHVCKTLQELRMLSNVTLNCQVTKIVMNSGSQLSEL